MIIKLRDGSASVIDDEDAALVGSGWLHVHPSRARHYAGRWVRRDGRRIFEYMHRLILAVAPGQEVDHVNGDGLDNRRANLRACSRAENTWNQKTLRAGKTSRYKGVSWSKAARKWRAEIRSGETGSDGRAKTVVLGLFHSEDEAARAYDSAAVANFGVFAATNFCAPTGRTLERERFK